MFYYFCKAGYDLLNKWLDYHTEIQASWPAVTRSWCRPSVMSECANIHLIWIKPALHVYSWVEFLRNWWPKGVLRPILVRYLNSEFVFFSPRQVALWFTHSWCKQPRPGFELMSLYLFLKSITITPWHSDWIDKQKGFFLFWKHFTF